MITRGKRERASKVWRGFQRLHSTSLFDLLLLCCSTLHYTSSRFSLLLFATVSVSICIHFYRHHAARGTPTSGIQGEQKADVAARQTHQSCVMSRNHSLLKAHLNAFLLSLFTLYKYIGCHVGRHEYR